MATKTASKQGLRAAAARRIEKAAQRTPLPPKAENIQLAREAVAEHKSVKKTTTRAKAPAPKATVTDTKASKAERHVAHFESHGWTVKITREGDRETFLAERGSEVIHQVWVSGVWRPDEGGTWTIGDRTIKVRNAAEASRWAARTPEEAAKQYNRATTSKYRKKPVQTAVLPEKMPFALDAPDSEVIAALAGKTVHWTNVYRDEEEFASVPKSSRFTKIVDAPDGSRVFMFCSPESGFRAFRLNALTRISGRTVKAAA